MTNADKFLKDEKYIFDIAKGIAEAICYDDMGHLKEITEKEIADWFTSNTKPTLTEDERVILRNMPQHIIGGDENGYYENGERAKSEPLYLTRNRGKIKICWYEGDKKEYMEAYGKLFQFIKERRRIQYRGVTRR